MLWRQLVSAGSIGPRLVIDCHSLPIFMWDSDSCQVVVQIEPPNYQGRPWDAMRWFELASHDANFDLDHGAVLCMVVDSIFGLIELWRTFIGVDRCWCHFTTCSRGVSLASSSVVCRILGIVVDFFWEDTWADELHVSPYALFSTFAVVCCELSSGQMLIPDI